MGVQRVDDFEITRPNAHPRNNPPPPRNGRRHLCHDQHAPGGTVACYCPLSRDHDVATFHDQANPRRTR